MNTFNNKDMSDEVTSVADHAPDHLTLLEFSIVYGLVVDKKTGHV